MNAIVGISTTKFQLNGIKYLKNYVSRVVGDRVEVFNNYERADVLIPLTDYAEFSVNGTIYDSAANLQAGLLDVLFYRNTLQPGGDPEPYVLTLQGVTAEGNTTVDDLIVFQGTVKNEYKYNRIKHFGANGRLQELIFGENADGSVQFYLPLNKTGAKTLATTEDFALGETASTAYRGDRGKIAYDHTNTEGNPHNTQIRDITVLLEAVSNLPKVKFSDPVASSLVTSSTSLTVLKSYFLPPNSIANGILDIYAAISKAGSAGTVIVQFLINTTNTPTGATSIATYTSTTNTRTMPFSRKFVVRGGTSLIGFNSAISAITDTVSNSSSTTTSFDVTQGYYLMVVVTLQNGADSIIQDGFEMINRKAT